MSFVRLLTVAFVAASAMGCGAATPPAATPTVSFRMTGGPETATVIIDDHPIGPLGVIAKRGIALPVGQHRITVEAPSYLPFDRIVVAEDRPIVLDVKLVPIPD